jgi:hypothetical protein
MNYRVGDYVWYVPGYDGCNLIAIKVQLQAKDDWGCYFVDEPVGHSVLPEHLFATREEAAKELTARSDLYHKHAALRVPASLKSYREFKKEVWFRHNGDKKFPSCSNKIEGQDWFAL